MKFQGEGGSSGAVRWVTKPSTIELKKIDIWLQIHDLPDGFFPKVKALSATVGEFIYAEPKSQDFEGNFA